MTAADKDRPSQIGVGECHHLLRQARLRKPSPNDPSRPMSQRELAEAVTTHVQQATGRDIALDRNIISRWERGKRRPIADYRDALRAVLGVTTDDEPGCTTSQGWLSLRIETIRFAARTEEDAYFIRAMHQLAAGCLLLDAKDRALTVLVDVVSRAVGERRGAQDQVAG